MAFHFRVIIKEKRNGVTELREQAFIPFVSCLISDNFRMEQINPNDLLQVVPNQNHLLMNEDK